MQHRRNKKHNAYKEANEAFLQVKAQEEGMVVLDNGVLYKVLEQGHGTKKPTPRSIVYVHYTGRRGCTKATNGKCTSPPNGATAP